MALQPQAAEPRPPAPARRGRRKWRLALVIFLALVLGDYLLYPVATTVGGRSANKGENGLWLRYTWYFGEHSDAEIIALARRLRERQIRFAYLHVRYVTPEGRLKFRYPEHARRLVGLLHRHAPEVKALAWVFVGGDRTQPHVDLDDAHVRRRAVQEAVWLVKTCGFDGVQWDYEVCRSGDPREIILLRETRAALPAGAILSTCASPWYPAPVTRWYGWDEGYFARVAAQCDQIAVMTYDTGMYLSRGYVWLVREQARRVPCAVAAGNPNCRVLLGLPTYEAGGGPGHHPRAENLRLALKGVREGAGQSPAFAGIALFADYTTSPEEWREYDLWWGRR